MVYETVKLIKTMKVEPQRYHEDFYTNDAMNNNSGNEYV